MVSQEEKVEGEVETTAADDAAKFSGAWDELEAKETGQSAEAAERPDGEADDESQGGKEAGQGEAKAGQPDASASPEADAAAAASREQTSDDLWKDADPKLREAHENALKEAAERATRAENQARSNGGRLAKALNELDGLQKQLADKAGAEGSEATSDEIDKLKQDYPEIADPLLKQIEKLSGQVEALTTSATARAQSEVGDALASEYEALRGLHSDMGEIVKAPEYAKWLGDQAPSIQRIVQENSKAVVSAADTALVFDKFKRDTGFGTKSAAELSEAQKRADQLDAGRSATGATQPGVRSDTKQDGTFESEWDRLDRADKQKASKRR